MTHKLISLVLVTASLLPVSSYGDWKFNRQHGCDHLNSRSYDISRGSHFGESYNDSAFRYGIRTGKLSRNEVRELWSDKNQIRRKELAYRSDGYISRGERRDLARDIEEYRKDFRHELNDGERRRW